MPQRSGQGPAESSDIGFDLPSRRPTPRGEPAHDRRRARPPRSSIAGLGQLIVLDQRSQPQGGLSIYGRRKP